MTSPTQIAPLYWVKQGRPAVVLAPMEGVTDFPMRALLSATGGYSYSVAEFIRVSQEPQPVKVFVRDVPELLQGGRTSSGIPVQVQLLGGDPDRVAQSALNALKVGAWGIDLNFGCPAPTVNRNDGGATLLKHPERIRSIVSAVRRAVPKDLPVSAKLRLGWDTMDAIHLNADMAAEGGAAWITIHGRTRTQGYQPPAYWGPIGEVRRRLGIPVIANGEIWTLDDFERCRDQTGSEHFMLGRGAMANPMLPLRISRALGILDEEIDPDHCFLEPGDWVHPLERFVEISLPYSKSEVYTLRRMKQWIGMANMKNKLPWFDAVKTSPTIGEFLARLRTLAGSSELRKLPGAFAAFGSFAPARTDPGSAG